MQKNYKLEVQLVRGKIKMRNNCRLEVLLFAFRLLATATHSFGNSHLTSHHRPHTMLPTHCPRLSHPPADELALAVLEVASLFPAGGQVLLQPWINSKFYFIYTPSPGITYHLLLCQQVVVEQHSEISEKIADCLLLCHQGTAKQPPDFSQKFGDQ